MRIKSNDTIIAVMSTDIANMKAVWASSFSDLKADLLEIKTQIKELKSDFVTRVEYSTLEEKVHTNKNVNYFLLTTVVVESIGLVYAMIRNYMN